MLCERYANSYNYGRPYYHVILYQSMFYLKIIIKRNIILEMPMYQVQNLEIMPSSTYIFFAILCFMLIKNYEITNILKCTNGSVNIQYYCK